MGFVEAFLDDGCGTGAHGTWMPSDDFMNGKRATSWTNVEAGDLAVARMYIDQRRIFRQVRNIRTLKRGDHCIIAAKLFRTVSRRFDYCTSLFSFYDIVGVYHHFVLLDDVASVDDFGVPRSSTGDVVKILEHTNTCREAARMVWSAAGRSFLRIPATLLPFFRNMGQCKSVPLCDYGDFPCFFKFEDHIDETTRQRIVTRASEMESDHDAYNMFINNCEHCANVVCSNSNTSPQVLVFLRNVTFLIGRCACLELVLRSKSTKLRKFALALYYIIALRSTGAHALLQFARVMRCVRDYYEKDRLGKADCYSLLMYEGGRASFTGIGACLAMLRLPTQISLGLISRSGAFNVCAFAYCWLDILYGMSVQALRSGWANRKPS